MTFHPTTIAPHVRLAGNYGDALEIQVDVAGTVDDFEESHDIVFAALVDLAAAYAEMIGDSAAGVAQSIQENLDFMLPLAG